MLLIKITLIKYFEVIYYYCDFPHIRNAVRAALNFVHHSILSSFVSADKRCLKNIAFQLNVIESNFQTKTYSSISF